MIIQGHIFLVFVLLLLGALTLWIFITSSKTRWFVKAIVTIALLLSISSAWIGLRAIYGFPYNSYPNNESYFLVGSYIVEPNPKTGHKGNIFLWLIPKKQANQKMDWLDKLGLVVNTTVPRAWIIPYNREMHKQLKGLDKARQGNAIAVKSIRKRRVSHIQAIISKIVKNLYPIYYLNTLNLKKHTKHKNHHITSLRSVIPGEVHQTVHLINRLI